MILSGIITDLSEKGYSIQRGFLDAAESAALGQELGALAADGHFQAAAVGRGTGTRVRETIRSDVTYWIAWDQPARLTVPQRRLADRLETLRLEVNRELALGAWDWEGHYAIYPPGSAYALHRDQFGDDSRRLLSVVLYFNPDWIPDHGGELVLYPEGRDPMVVEPREGTFVCFLSDRIAHEVRVAHAARRSFAGWFRRRS